jgi:hypothetical protein
MAGLQELIVEVRRLRKEYGVPEGQRYRHPRGGRRRRPSSASCRARVRGVRAAPRGWTASASVERARTAGRRARGARQRRGALHAARGRDRPGARARALCARSSARLEGHIGGTQQEARQRGVRREGAGGGRAEGARPAGAARGASARSSGTSSPGWRGHRPERGTQRLGPAAGLRARGPGRRLDERVRQPGCATGRPGGSQAARDHPHGARARSPTVTGPRPPRCASTSTSASASSVAGGTLADAVTVSPRSGEVRVSHGSRTLGRS